MNKRNYPIYHYTTPSIVLHFGGLNLTDVDELRIKLQRGKTSILRTSAEVGQMLLDTKDNTATISLTQGESAAFSGGLATVQAHMKLKNGAVLASAQQKVFFDENIDREMM